MGTQHAPEPWIKNPYNQLQILDATGEAIVARIIDTGDDEADASADLIAAAPNLLMAAKHALAWITQEAGCSRPEALIDELQAAIAGA